MEKQVENRHGKGGIALCAQKSPKAGRALGALGKAKSLPNRRGSAIGGGGGTFLALLLALFVLLSGTAQMALASGSENGEREDGDSSERGEGSSSGPSGALPFGAGNSSINSSLNASMNASVNSSVNSSVPYMDDDDYSDEKDELEEDDDSDSSEGEEERFVNGTFNGTVNGTFGSGRNGKDYEDDEGNEDDESEFEEETEVKDGNGRVVKIHLKSKYKEAEEKEEEHKEEFEEERHNYTKTSEDFMKVKERYGKMRSENRSDPELVLRAKSYLLSSAQYLDGFLRQVSDFVILSNSSDVNATAAWIVSLDGYRSDLAALEANISAANTTSEISAYSLELQSLWRESKKESKRIFGLSALDMLGRMTLRMEFVWDKINEIGMDVSSDDRSEIDSEMAELKDEARLAEEAYASYENEDGNEILARMQSRIIGLEKRMREILAEKEAA